MDEKILVTQSSMPPFEEYMEMIKPLWESHWLTNMGDYHKCLENELRTYLKVPEISLTVNGHMALELALQSLNLPKGGGSNYHTIYLYFYHSCDYPKWTRTGVL